jgi:Flp pilus assembly pilin Flp
MLPADPRTRERGATLAEYGLLVALVSLVSIVALGGLASAARGTLDDTAAEIAADPASSPSAGGGGAPSPSTPTTAAGAPTTTTPTTVPVTTTTAAPTTTAPPTTAAPTTAPPTTAAPTTAPPTTAPPVNSPIAGTGSGARQWWDNWGQRGAWVATATITNSHNRPAWVHVEVSAVYGDGRVVRTTTTVYVGPNGSTPFSTYDNVQSKNATAADDVVQVQVRPTGGITYTSGWNETPLVVSGTSITATAPSMP